MKQLKMAVDELTIEISNTSEMYDFVRLKKEIYAAYLDLSRKYALLKCVEEPILNLRAVDNLNQVSNQPSTRGSKPYEWFSSCWLKL